MSKYPIEDIANDQHCSELWINRSWTMTKTTETMARKGKKQSRRAKIASAQGGSRVHRKHIPITLAQRVEPIED